MISPICWIPENYWLEMVERLFVLWKNWFTWLIQPNACFENKTIKLIWRYVTFNKTNPDKDPISLDYDLLSGLGLSADSLGFASAPKPVGGAPVLEKPAIPSGSFFARAPSKAAPSKSARCSGPNGKSPKIPRQTEVRNSWKNVPYHWYDIRECIYNIMIYNKSTWPNDTLGRLVDTIEITRTDKL